MLRPIWVSCVRWFDSNATGVEAEEREFGKTDYTRLVPVIAMHVMCLAVIWTGWSVAALTVAAAFYFLRMFAITGFYHRYFSHRAFKTSRVMQFLFAVLGNSAAQRGPLWWAAHHRHHHRHSDTERDIHSPKRHGIWHSHIGWLTRRDSFASDHQAVKDLARFPELRFLDRFDILVPALLAVSLFGLGALLERKAPHLGTNGWQLLTWGFFISSVALLHGTCLINSMAHLIGTRRYETSDDSRNSLVLALITLGEGWHNNHHKYPGVTRQGFFWWEIDITYYLLRFMALLGLVWDFNAVPEAATRNANPEDASIETRPFPTAAEPGSHV